MHHKNFPLPFDLVSFLLLSLALLLWPLDLGAQAPPTEEPAKEKKDMPESAPASRPEQKEDEKKEEQKEEEEEEEDDEDDDEVDDYGLDTAPFTEEQKKFLKEWSQKFKAGVLGDVPKPEPPKLSLKWRAETYTKILYQNDQSQGSVTFGTPHPRGDNYAGNNGFASELVLHLDGRVSDKVEVGARIKSRFHRQWADFYENGDLAVDKTSGEPAGVDSTGESLGANHAAYIQLRGLYLRMSPPIPTIKSVLFGSSDLAMFNAWTVGKVRYIDRDNANGIFVDGGFWNIGYTLARISLPKLYSSAGWNSGIDDPLVQNPFWTRDATYVLKVSQEPAGWLNWNLITSYLLDEEADLNDPDSLGSTNFVDERDGVVATLPRYQNVNSTLEVGFTRWKLDGNILVGFSRSDPDLDYVFNSVDGNQGISPIPLKTANSYAAKARFDLLNLADGLDIRLEYFNIGADWVATFGARRETDVLLTDGFLDGQVPTLNIANEFIDFRDDFYEAIIGWHGATISPKYVRGALETELEFTLIEYNTDAQDRCTRNELTDETGARIESSVCPQDADGSGKFYGVYPDFLFPDGMTDTDFFSYANTNDRGRDPRAVYRQNQARRSYIGMLKLGYQFDVGRGLRWDTKLKYILDQDLRDLDLEQDDYLGHLVFFQTRFGTQLTDELSVALGFKFDWWDEAHRSRKGLAQGGTPSYPDYRTLKTNVFFDLKYQFGGATLAWYMEWLNKDVRITRADGTEHPDSFAFRNVVRGIGTISASF
jgi:hypothetical protein